MQVPRLLLTAAFLGAVASDSCEEPPRRFLVTTSRSNAIYIWPQEQVTLVCRPSREIECSWKKDEEVLGEGCQLETSRTGTIKCMVGEETIGSIKLQNPASQGVRRIGDQYHYYSRSWDYYRGNPKQGFLCSNTGNIIDSPGVCDGTKHCTDGQDEEGCSMSCGAPPVRAHSSITSASRPEYPDGASITYRCTAGFAFAETLSGLNRTCRRGRWDQAPPACRANLALGRPVSVTGTVMACGDGAAAVDGRVDTWCMLMPSTKRTRLAVPLDTEATSLTVLVRALSSEYQIALRAANGTGDGQPCSCGAESEAAAHPTVSSVRVCSCDGGALETPLEVVVSDAARGLSTLSVAEIVVTDAAGDGGAGAPCAALGRPAHGTFTPAGDDSVTVTCEPGYTPTCDAPVSCSRALAGVADLGCVPVSCGAPPTFPYTSIADRNGTGWGSVTRYTCAPGYVLFPPEQRTASRCADGLWSLSHVACLAESDVRVVALRMSGQHERSVAALRGELARLLQGQQETQRRLQLLEAEVEQLRREQGDVVRLGLADIDPRLQDALGDGVQEELEDELQEPGDALQDSLGDAVQEELQEGLQEGLRDALQEELQDALQEEPGDALQEATDEGEGVQEVQSAEQGLEAAGDPPVHVTAAFP